MEKIRKQYMTGTAQVEQYGDKVREALWSSTPVLFSLPFFLSLGNTATIHLAHRQFRCLVVELKLNALKLPGTSYFNTKKHITR